MHNKHTAHKHIATIASLTNTWLFYNPYKKNKFSLLFDLSHETRGTNLTELASRNAKLGEIG